MKIGKKIFALAVTQKQYKFSNSIPNILANLTLCQNGVKSVLKYAAVKCKSTS